jgi:ABC-2 type transport system ATP-binding protein
LNAAVVLDKVSKSFGKTLVIDDVCLKIEPSELFGLLGPSGAGKTTLVKIMSGLCEADKGSAYVLGEKMPSLKSISRIGLMTQADALYNDLTAWDNLDFFASVYGLHGSGKKNRIAELLELVTLTSDSRKKVRAFSGGMKRRLSLAIAMIHRPEVLILDEPTIGMDPVLRKTVWYELKELQKSGTAIILTTHAMEEAEKCQRLGMIRQGRMIAVGTPEELKSNTSGAALEDAFIAYAGGAI